MRASSLRSSANNMDRVLTAEREADLGRLSSRLGISFHNLALLDQALTHTSYANEAHDSSVQHNERLEFLGDAVLELASSTYLFNHFPNLSEGDLSKARASVVCEPALHRRAAELQLGDFLLLGHGERLTGGAKRPSILADAFEAVIGAIYLDQGFEAARTYILEQLHQELVEVDLGENLKDYKTMLQEVVQRHPGRKAIYRLIGEEGPDHAKEFCFSVSVDDKVLGVGKGRTKKAAEQNAARAALETFKKK